MRNKTQKQKVIPTIKNPRVLNTFARQLDKANPCKYKDTPNECLTKYADGIVDYENICDNCQSIARTFGSHLPKGDAALANVSSSVKFEHYHKRAAFSLKVAIFNELSEEVREEILANRTS